MYTYIKYVNAKLVAMHCCLLLSSDIIRKCALCIIHVPRTLPLSPLALDIITPVHNHAAEA